MSRSLPGSQQGNEFTFSAFGEECRIQPDRITLGGKDQTGVPGIIISLYALHAQLEPCRLEPLKAFREFPNSMPYAGAFASNTENILVPHVDKIEMSLSNILGKLQGSYASSIVKGDYCFLLRPLPKITLCYIFYRADEEFSASVTCLFSNNALTFLPLAALADLGECTSLKILSLLD